MDKFEYRTSLAGRLGSLIDVGFGTFRGFVRLVLGELEFVSGRLRPFVEIRPQEVKRLVFVCLGNICRSPMAEAIFQDMVNKAGLSSKIMVDSAGIG